MYSLEQVIFFLEQRQQTEDWNIRDQAITYLKGYLEVLPEYAHMKLDAVKNDPLTWDELKQMEGKPVWIEEQYSFDEEWYGHWEVISSFCDDEFVDDPDPVVYMTDDEVRHKNDLGKTWQAYRKERS